MTHKFVSLLFLLLILSCEEREWKNIYDPEGSNPTEWAPQTFVAHQVSDRAVRLVWEQFDERIDGFHLNRKTGDQEWVEKYRSFNADLRSWTDTIMQIGQIQKYELYAFADQALSTHMTLEFIPVFEGPEILEISHISSSVIKLEWETHPYPTVNLYHIERSVNGAEFQHYIQTSDITVYDSTLNQSDIYTYRIRAVTDVNISTPGQEAYIRWDHIGYEAHWLTPLPYYHAKPSPDGQFIAAWKENDLSLFDLETGTRLWTADPGAYYPGNVLFSSDNQYLLSITGEHFFKVWDRATGLEAWTGNHEDKPNNRVFAVMSPDGRKIASTDSFHEDQEVNFSVWNTSDGTVLWSKGLETGIGMMIFSPDNTELLTGDKSGNIDVWNVSDGTSVRQMTLSKPVKLAHFSHDGNHLAVTMPNDESYENQIEIIQVQNGSEIMQGSHESMISSLDFSPDDQYLITASFDDTLKVWNTTNGTLVYARSGGPPASFNPDNTLIISGGGIGIRVYNSESGSQFWQDNTPGYSWNTEFIGDGDRLLSSSEAGTMVWHKQYGWHQFDTP